MADTSVPLASPTAAETPPPAPPSEPQRPYDPGVPTSIEYPPLPLPSFLRAAARLYPRHAAIIFEGARISYRELDRLADACAAGLRAAGIAPGDRVALVLPNLPQFPIAFYGALRAGAVVVACNPLYTPPELAHQLADCGATTVIALDRFVPTVDKACAISATAVSRIFSADVAPFLPPHLRAAYRLKRTTDRIHFPRRPGTGASSHHAPGGKDMAVSSFETLLKDFRDRPCQEAERTPGDLAVLQYTGGTTGRPKAAMLTHANLVANTLQTWSWDVGGKHGREVILCVAPFFHIYGLTVGLNLAVYGGATMVLQPRFKAEVVARAIKRYRPTMLPGVPTMYVAIADLAEKQGLDCSSLRVCVSGAAPLPLEVQQRFEQLTGGSLVEGYGLSEASPVTHCNPILGTRVAGSIGLPYPDTEARIDPDVLRRDDRQYEGGPSTASDPCIGELLVRGPQVMRGYWNRPEETAAVLQDGWLRTGDIARVDERGYYTVVDRAKDVIIAGGFNVYPREVEEVLYAHPAVYEAVVIGVPDPYRGETVKAVIVLREEQATATPAPAMAHPQTPAGEPADREQLRAHITAYCREHLAAYKVPKQIEFRDDLPKSMIGKILRRALRDEVQSP
jgi:long-chain acyl-CoA synthetase